MSAIPDYGMQKLFLQKRGVGCPIYGSGYMCCYVKRVFFVVVVETTKADYMYNAEATEV